MKFNRQCLLNLPGLIIVSFYEKESINANWSVRELKRQLKHHFLKDYSYQLERKIKKKS